MRGTSGPAQGNAHWIFYPNRTSPSGVNRTGEVTFFNTVGDLDIHAQFVRNHSLGGVFTWIATSDAHDWRVHRQLYAALNEH